MKYLSVCSGIESASVAWEPLGFTPVAFSEIEPFPSAVLKHRFPHVPNLGDMTKFEEWDIDGAVDVLVGGTPCQSFSVAGLRRGLTDDRGNLALVYCRILQQYRPRWFVWENVPGVLSSNGGRDFGSILGAMAELGYGLAYRILDARYFGVPQRRRRVFVVGCLGNWRNPAAVLFEPGCVRGDSAKSRKTKSAFAALTANGVGTCSADDNQGQAGHLIAHALRGEGFDASEDGTGRGTPLVAVRTSSNCGAYETGDRIDALTTGTDQTSHLLVPSTGRVAHCLNAGGMGRQDYETETMVACTLPASDGGVSSGYHPVIAIQERAVSTNETNGPQGAGFRTDGKAYTLEARNKVQAVAFAENSRGELRLEGGDGLRTGALSTGGGKPGQGMPTIAGSIGVRRLTPRECERLQGFPDDWTQVPYRGKQACDGPRYKAIGNSKAVPVVRWIGRRIAAVDALKPTPNAANLQPVRGAR